MVSLLYEQLHGGVKLMNQKILCSRLDNGTVFHQYVFFCASSNRIYKLSFSIKKIFSNQQKVFLGVFRESSGFSLYIFLNDPYSYIYRIDELELNLHQLADYVV